MTKKTKKSDSTLDSTPLSQPLLFGETEIAAPNTSQTTSTTADSEDILMKTSQTLTQTAKTTTVTDQSGPCPVPAGEYRAVLCNGFYYAAQQYYCLTFEIASGQYYGRKLFKRFYFKSPASTSFGNNRLRDLGIPDHRQHALAGSCSCMIIVEETVYTLDDGNRARGNKVVDFYDVSFLFR